MNSLRPVLSVSALTSLIKNSLETGFSSVSVEGEISGAKLSSSGHLYFSLKDREALIQAVMFKFRMTDLDFNLVDGLKVIVRGSISVYAARGQYQLIASSVRKSGIGDLLAAIEERKRRLEAEGLFDAARKRPIPRLPERVGVITSPTGAAIRDILNVIGRRNSGIHTILLPAAVQGDDAPSQLVARIEQANRLNIADVLILGRGGGAAEDLLAFSDETVVRAVAASRIPVISAVGHETDWALSDFAADLRAPTPSAAAELVAESKLLLEGEIAHMRSAMSAAIRSRMQAARMILNRFSARDAEARFMRIFMPIARRLDESRDALAEEMRSLVRDRLHRLELSFAKLAMASPVAVLKRGYAIVRRSVPDSALEGFPGNGDLVRNARMLKPGQKVDIIFGSGSARSEVEEVRK
jgi:exodeoxyribonuclease VII large subunit